MDKSAFNALRKGQLAITEGRLEEARQIYRNILDKNPEISEAVNGLGLIEISKGNIENSLEFFKSAIKKNPSVTKYWKSYIESLLTLGKTSDANKVLSQALKKGANKTSFDHLINHLKEPPSEPLQSLVQLYTTNQLDKAEIEALKLLSAHPNAVVLYNILGAIFTKRAKFQEAIRYFEKAIKLNPQYADSYFNMANTLKEKKEFKRALKYYDKALERRNSYAEAHQNKGDIQRALGLSDQALGNYRKALKIKKNLVSASNNMAMLLFEQKEETELAHEILRKIIIDHPNYATAHGNFGKIHSSKGDFRSAEKYFKKAIAIGGESIDNLTNLGAVQMEQGEYWAAVDTYIMALKIDPHSERVWNNLIFPLKVLTWQTKLDKKKFVDELPIPKTKRLDLFKSLLNYQLCIGHGRSLDYFRQATQVANTLGRDNIRNPKHVPSKTIQIKSKQKQMFSLVHFGRSGTGLFHSLIDNHPEIATLPSFYFSEFFNPSTWDQLISDGWDSIIDNFVKMYEVFFTAADEGPIASKSTKLLFGLGKLDGMDRLGEHKDHVLGVDKAYFCATLRGLLESCEFVDASVFFRLVHVAYETVVYGKDTKSKIFYHIHNPSPRALFNLHHQVPDVKTIVLLREPIQSCESWIRDSHHAGKHMDSVSKIIEMIYQTSDSLYHEKTAVGIRLEDLKRRSKETIKALCRWMNIEDVASLYQMTAQGMRWWGDPVSPDFEKEGMEPFGTLSIDRSTGSVFSERDQFVLSTLFYPFNSHFGYVKNDLKQFESDLMRIRPMLEDLFDFEKRFFSSTFPNVEKLLNSGAHNYFRACLITRWEQLKSGATLPIGIETLDIVD